MPAQTSGSLTTTGSVTLTKPAADTHVVAALDGTYGTVTLVFEGSVDGSNYAPLATQRLDTGAVVSGTVALTDNSEVIYVVPAPALVGVRVRATAVGSGTLGVTLVSGSYIGLPAAPVNSTSVVATGALTSSSATAGLGYATGAGGAVTQATNRTTGVTLNKVCGAITTDAASLAAGAEATFTVTNSTVAATDTVLVCLKTPSATGLSLPFVSTVAAGSFDITLTNLHASTADTSASVINFVVVKAVAA